MLHRAKAKQGWSCVLITITHSSYLWGVRHCSVLCILTFPILTMLYWYDCYYSHFTDEETEVWGLSCTHAVWQCLWLIWTLTWGDPSFPFEHFGSCYFEKSLNLYLLLLSGKKFINESFFKNINLLPAIYLQTWVYCLVVITLNNMTLIDKCTYTLNMITVFLYKNGMLL